MLAVLARKKKSQDDEPLVPHGLISQALDSPASSNSEPEPAEDRTSSARPPEKSGDRDPRLPKPPQPVAANKPAKPASGHLLRWPKVKQQLGESRAHIAAAFPGVRALPKHISDRAAKVRALLQGSQSLSRVRALAASRADQVRQELKSVREHAIPELQKVRDSAQVPAKVALLRQGISTAANSSKDTWRAVRANAVPHAQSFRQSFSAATRKSIEIGRGWRTSAAPRFQSIWQRASTGTKNNMEACRAWEANTAEKVRAWKESRRLVKRVAWTQASEKSPREGFKLRIRFAGLPLKLRLTIAQAKLEWQLGRESVSRDSRLWSSIALGALAALLVMGLFSTARHFAQASLPSNHVSANALEDTGANSAAMAPQTQPVPVKARLRQVSPKDNHQVEEVRPKTSVSKPKARSESDSDYVAKDTYVYYGNRSRSTK